MGYRLTFGEPDMGSMVTGIVYGAVSGDPHAVDWQYGLSFSFGFYQLLYALIPLDLLRSPDHVTQVINLVGLAFSLLFAVSLALLLGRVLARPVALFVSIAFLFSPLAMPFLASGHPFIGACGLLFLGTWLLLLTADAPSPARALGLGALALSALVASMTLRGDIALALPFVPATWWAVRQRPLRDCWRQVILVALVPVLAFGAFLLLQHPYVSTHGGAGGSLMGFVNKFVALDRVGRGVVVFVMVLGLGTIAGLLAGAARLARKRTAVPAAPLLCALAALFLPSFLFWLPNPQPARHFLFPLLALFILIGLLWADQLRTMRRALGLAVLLVLANQLLAEATRPLIVSRYQWAYDSGGIRRATQQVPMGLFPLDQRANWTTQQRFHEEARRLAASAPERLVFMGDTKEYVVTALLAADPALRLRTVKLGTFDAWLLSAGKRQLYLVDKRFQWPGDALAVMLAMPEVADYPIYVQTGTMSRYDKTPLPPGRAYRTMP
ncbi:hypothetical protein ACLB1G_22460 [Oxalobacteraceae bacterium A2-2]